MNDFAFLATMLACLALTFGLMRMCATLMPEGTPSHSGSDA